MALVTIIAAFLALTAVAFVLALNSLGRAYRTLRREEIELLAAETWPIRSPRTAPACRTPKIKARRAVARRHGGSPLSSSFGPFAGSSP